MAFRHLLLIMLAVMAAACTRDPERLKIQYVHSGDRYLAQKQYQDAILEYRRAVLVAPKFGEARYKLAEAYAAIDDVRNALPEYVRAADLLPEDSALQLKAGNLLLLGGRFQDAKTRARTVLKGDPKNVPALVLLGNALAGLRSLDDAVAVAERITDLVPGRPGVYSNLGALRLAHGDRDLAEAAFKKAVEVGPNTVPPYLALANFYRASGSIPDAQRALRSALKIEPKNLDANRAMGQLLVEASRASEAEPYFKTAAAASHDIPSQVALADYYVTIKKPEAALAILDRLAGDSKAYTTAKTRIAVVQASMGRRPDAYRTVDELLAKSPKDVSAQALKAQLLLADHRAGDALTVIQRAVTLDPRSPQVQLMRGRVLVALNQLEDARKAFNEALDLDRLGLGVEAAIELARLHMQRREMDTSIAYAEQGVQTHPESLDARLTLIRTLTVRSEDYPRAEREVRDLLARYPAQAQVHAAWGNVCILNRNPVEARKAYERALQLDADNVDGWTGLMVLNAGSKQLRDVGQRLETRIQSSTRKAELFVINAKVAALSHDVNKVEGNLKESIRVEPGQLEGYQLLGQLYVAQGRIEAAQQEFLKVAQLDSGSIGAPTVLGLLYSAQNNVAEAERWYERAVQINPREASAASNNLAWMYAERGGNLDAALRLAQYAASQVPDQPQFNDTLGWVYYKREMTEQAIRSLQVAASTVPSNPTYQFHLGMAYAQAGDDSKARKALEASLKLAPNFAGADEARIALKSLVY